MRDTFKKEIRCQKNRTAGYIFGLLDSRMPKPNLSNRGTTLLLLMLKRGTKTRIIALQVLIRIWAKLANERASSRSSVEDPAAPRSGSDDQASGLGSLSRETGVSGNFVGRIKGVKCPFDLQFLTWDFS